MMEGEKKMGDFGNPEMPIPFNQVVGIFDLVGFTDIPSNKRLYTLVVIMEKQFEFALYPSFTWNKRTNDNFASSENDVLLRSTGDGYVVAFSHHVEELKILQTLVNIYENIKFYHPVTLGINKGENFVVKDINGQINIIGWGINLAARALHFAEENQIICTEYFAKPLLQNHSKEVNDEIMIDLGEQQVKKTNLRLYNYFKEGEFGAPVVGDQK